MLHISFTICKKYSIKNNISPNVNLKIPHQRLCSIKFIRFISLLSIIVVKQLSSYLHSNDVDRTRKLSKKFRAWNSWITIVPRIPFRRNSPYWETRTVDRQVVIVFSINWKRVWNWVEPSKMIGRIITEVTLHYAHPFLAKWSRIPFDRR